ncbi:MAG: hypothetical protein NTW31_11965 [Bacteroidetes bacterium]|nr:hypothetical protein [Bacteroidota bacterium]
MRIKAGKFKKPGKTVKEMTIAAGNAMKNGFYTEAIWILSGIMEARLKKLIIITEGRNPGAASGLEQHLKRIKLLQTREPYSTLKTHFPSTLVSSLREWKNNRNTMMKDMLEMHVSWERRERLSKQGISLLKSLNKVYKHYRLAVHAPAEDLSLPPGEIVQEKIEKTAVKPAPAQPVPPSA